MAVADLLEVSGGPATDLAGLVDDGSPPSSGSSDGGGSADVVDLAALDSGPREDPLDADPLIRA